MASGGRDDRPGFSFMDGVPVKIGEKYKPPRKVTLPVGFHPKIPVELLSEEYDFSLERHVIDYIEGRQREQAASKLARQTRLKAQEEEAEKQKQIEQEAKESEPNDPEAVTDDNEEEVQDDKAAPEPSEVKGQESKILIPTPAGSATRQATLSTLPQLNLADFEADTSSPFDNMELKTINDMEELAHVLWQPDSQYRSNYVGGGSNNNFATYPTTQTNGYYPTYAPEKINGNNNETTCGVSYTAPYSTNSYSTAYGYYGQQYATPSTWTNASYMASSYTLPYGAMQQNMQYVSPYPDPNYQSGSSVVSEDGSSVGGMRTSKSVPDLVQELGKELERQSLTMMDKRKSAQTPPPRVPSIGTIGMENWKPWPELDSPSRPLPSTSMSSTLSRSFSDRLRRGKGKEEERSLPPTSSPSKSSSSSPASSHSSPQLPNPFSELDEEAQGLVRKISEMGFPLDRVARACQRLGADDKKIVEHLIQVQGLEEHGFSVEHAEKALLLHEQSEEEATKHLRLLYQFLGFGFPENKIMEALARSKNDHDQALDFLLS